MHAYITVGEGHGFGGKASCTASAQNRNWYFGDKHVNVSSHLAWHYLTLIFLDSSERVSILDIDIGLSSLYSDRLKSGSPQFDLSLIV